MMNFKICCSIIPGHAALTLRSRLRCIILRKDQETGKGGCPPTNLLVLNEVVIDRGPSPYLSNIDLYLDGKRITSVQGDGMYTIDLTDHCKTLCSNCHAQVCLLPRITGNKIHFYELVFFLFLLVAIYCLAFIIIVVHIIWHCRYVAIHT